MTWSDLPADLLRCISSHLYIIDFLRFSAVCTSWNSTLSNDTLLGIHCHPSPWLLLPSDVGEASDTLTFHDLTIKEEEGDVNIHYRFSSLTGYIFDRRCIGSKDGWLVTLDKMDLQPRIFNPLTKAEISLPSLFTIPEDKYHRIKLDDSSELFYDEIGHPCYATEVERFRDVYFRKIVMSSNDPFGTVVVIYGYIKLLALLRPNDKAWVLSPQLPPYHTDNWVDFEDVYYHEEEHRFYAITHFSAVLAFDLSGQNVELICPRINSVISTCNSIMNYIAFLFGNLIKIEREVELIDLPGESMTRKTTRISVLKLLRDVNAWIPIKDLEDFSFFVGCNQTFSLHHTVAPGIRPNCIYFTDNVENLSPDEVTHDAGFFDLHNDCFHYFLDSESQPNWPPSIWFVPSFL